jgi:hypothetical protein
MARMRGTCSQLCSVYGQITNGWQDKQHTVTHALYILLIYTDAAGNLDASPPSLPLSSVDRGTIVLQDSPDAAGTYVLSSVANAHTIVLHDLPDAAGARSSSSSHTPSSVTHTAATHDSSHSNAFVLLPSVDRGTIVTHVLEAYSTEAMSQISGVKHHLQSVPNNADKHTTKQTNTQHIPNDRSIANDIERISQTSYTKLNIAS